MSLLLKSLEFTSHFADKKRDTLNSILIEKHLNNIFRFVATDGFILSIIEIDFTEFENDLLILNKLFLNKEEVLINIGSRIFDEIIENESLILKNVKELDYTLKEKYISALKYNNNFDFVLMSMYNYPKYKEVIDIKLDKNECVKPIFNNSYLFRLTEAVNKLADFFNKPSIVFEIMNDNSTCQFRILSNDNKIIKNCFVILMPLRQ
jgi:hypothetical protein